MLHFIKIYEEPNVFRFNITIGCVVCFINMKTTDRTLSKVMSDLANNGYKEQFKAEKDSFIATLSSKKYSPSRLKVDERYRFDGMTNPSDESELIAITTDDGVKGTLVISLGKEQSEHMELIEKLG